ncbi:MAG TPA: protein kinase [Pirellulaceae bacterium]|jgi:serine/threonine protein kinase
MIDTPEPTDLQTLVRDKIDAWHAGQKPDASRLLAEYPALRNAKSLVLDLALAEYEARTAAGDEITKSDFCDRFPAYRQSLSRLLEVYEFLDQCPQFAVNDATRWPAPGDEFLGFEIVEPLGRGGMARVFLARQPELGNRQVVIKVSRFASREAHTLGKLSHPSIMPVFSVERDESAGWTVICMPLLGAATGVDLLDAAFSDGATRNAALLQRVARETRPLAVAAVTENERFDWNLTYPQGIAQLGIQLAEALRAAHYAGILHRDIKPSNVLLAWSGRPVLLDFNLSTDAAAMVPGVGGTLAYMAPEVIASVLTDKGQTARQFDPRYDIYSLGAVLYELLTNRLPAKPENAERLPLDAYEPWLECKRQATAALFAEPEGAVGGKDLQNIIIRCLSFDPAERFATATELVTALHNYIALTSPPRPLSPSPLLALGTPRPAKSRRAVLAAAVGLLGAGLVGFAAYHSTRRTPLELLYQQAIDEYNDKKYENAAATFTKCLEQKPGWTDSLFGRGQSFRKLEKWREARTDYMALKEANPAWAYALAGYCDIRLKDNATAYRDCMQAHEMGQREIPFLFNLARAQWNRQRYREAQQVYSEILSIDPHNLDAIQNRALAGVFAVVNQKTMIPSPECLADADEYNRLAGDTFEGPFYAAVVFGEAARKDSRFRKKAIDLLALALQSGLPIEATAPFPVQLKPLLSFVDASVTANAVHDLKYRANIRPLQEYSNTPDWNLFVQGSKSPHTSLARRR